MEVRVKYAGSEYQIIRPTPTKTQQGRMIHAPCTSLNFQVALLSTHCEAVKRVARSRHRPIGTTVIQTEKSR